MIRQLTIDNYAIIDHVAIDFNASLNIITGETGAGKSIILGALALIMGQRADMKSLHDTSRKCIVEAIFNGDNPAIKNILVENDFDVEDELIIRREIVPSGKSRAFVNDTPAKLDILHQLSVELIDLNQQFNLLDIQQPLYHLEMVDALAGNQDLLSQYDLTYKKYKDTNKRLKALRQMESGKIKEYEFMQFQLNELEEAELMSDEKTMIESEQEILLKSDDLRLLVEETRHLISDGELNISDMLSGLSAKWQNFSGVNKKVAELSEELINVEVLLNDFYAKADDILKGVDNDPERLSIIQDRLDLIYNLENKHGVQSVEELLGIQEDLQNQLAAFNNRTEDIEKLEKDLIGLEGKLDKISLRLRSNRVKHFPELEKSVKLILDELAMTSAEIKVDLSESEDFRPDGKDHLEILFKANKGGQLMPIKKVASGGEASRLMLALKSTVAEAMELPVLIFDEIDTGVSGEVAAKMGDILKKLASQHQLIAITHSPQVSSRADKHLFVYKEEHADKTTTHVKVLNQDERVIEIAKMLSGDPPSTFALDNAKDLLAQSIRN